MPGKHGGKRPGSGRPKGSKNKRSLASQLEAVGDGPTPLEFLIGVYQDEGKPEVMRMDAAKAAAPYVHSRFSNVDMSVSDDRRELPELSDAELADIAAGSGKGTIAPPQRPAKPAGVH